MKQRLLYISLLLLALAVAACAPIEDDLFTTARITVAATDGTSITGVQAHVKLTNVNTRQVTTVADFNGTSLSNRRGRRSGMRGQQWSDTPSSIPLPERLHGNRERTS